MANEAKQPQEAQEVTLIIARHDHAADGLLLPDGLVNAYMVGRNMQQAYGIKAIDHVYCSTLVRTQQTMLAQAIGMATHNGFEMPSYTIHDQLHEDTKDEIVWKFIQNVLKKTQEQKVNTIEIITHKPQVVNLLANHFCLSVTDGQLDCGCHTIIKAASWENILQGTANAKNQTTKNATRNEKANTPYYTIQHCSSSQELVDKIFNNNKLYTVSNDQYDFKQNEIQQLTDPTLRDQITAMQQMYNQAQELYTRPKQIAKFIGPWSETQENLLKTLQDLYQKQRQCGFLIKYQNKFLNVCARLLYWLHVKQ